MDIGYETLDKLSLLDLSSLLNKAFEGYVVPVQFNSMFLSEMIRTEAIDLSASLKVLIDRTEAGVALVARRGWTSRVAAMAICPEHRGTGIGSALMKQVIQSANSRGEKSLRLEVIEQNSAAIRLYESVGLRRMRRLVGFACDSPLSGLPPAELAEEIDIPAAARTVAEECPDLPWQIGGATLSQLSLPNRAYRLGPAHAIISDPERPAIAIRGLIVAPAVRRQGWGTRLIAALQSQFPGKSWRVSPVVPENLADAFFHSCSFQRTDLSQWEMAIDL